MNKDYLPIITPAILFLTGIGFLAFTYYKSVTGRPAALTVTSKYEDAEVVLRQKDLGKTPVDITDVKPGLAELVLRTDKNELRKEVILTEEAYTTVSSDVGVSDKFSATQVLWYDKTSGDDNKLFIATNPEGVTVRINNKEIGETPITVSNQDLLDTESNEYTIFLEKEGYETQKLNIKLEDNYTLNITADLFLKPIPTGVSGLDATNFYKIYRFKDPVVRNNQEGNWAQAVSYWLSTRGPAVIGTENIDGFDYFVDSEGTLYAGNGELLNAENTSIEEEPEQPLLIGYLILDDSDSVSSSAQETLSAITGTAVSSSEDNIYEVVQTGLGYLNVRAEPELDGELVHQLEVGEQVTVIGEQGDWYNIRFTNDEGEEQDAWVFSSYLNEVEVEEEVAEEE